MNKIPTNWHLCDGTNGTPDLTGRFLEGTTASIKQFKEAGLPNIYGTFGNTEEQSAKFEGAFFVKEHTIGGAAAERTVYDKINYLSRILGGPEVAFSEMEGFNVGMDARRVSSIYGKSDTVQPMSYTVYYIMRIK